MSQPKVGQYGCLVLRDCIAVDHCINIDDPQGVENLLVKASDSGRFVGVREVYRRSSHKFFGLPAEELSDRTRTVVPHCL